jgi:hypothetical protein
MSLPVTADDGEVLTLQTSAMLSSYAGLKTKSSFNRGDNVGMTYNIPSTLSPKLDFFYVSPPRLPAQMKTSEYQNIQAKASYLVLKPFCEIQINVTGGGPLVNPRVQMDFKGFNAFAGLGIGIGLIYSPYLIPFANGNYYLANNSNMTEATYEALPDINLISSTVSEELPGVVYGDQLVNFTVTASGSTTFTWTATKMYFFINYQLQF